MEVVTLNKVGKKFRFGNQRHSLLQGIEYFFTGKSNRKDLWALKSISLTVKKGEILGIVGANGAGKSTLLSLIAGVYTPDEGDLKVLGKIVSIIGLVSVLQDRLTLRDNIFLACSLYGLSIKECHEVEKDVIAFAHLEKFSDSKLYQFSGGMIARAIFSIAVHCQPDILLLDEATSNLDKDFTQLVAQTVENLRKKGVVVIVVSHKKEIIEKCDRVLYLDKGIVKLSGTSDQVVEQYFNDRASV